MKQAILDSLMQFAATDWIILSLFLLLFVTRLYYLIFFQGRIVFSGRKEVVANEKSLQPLSVFLTVRNEEENLRRLLPQLLNIKEASYEVVVVDDYSLDNTFSVLGSFKQFPNFHFSSLNEETRFSVKLAQNIALKAARNEWVLTLPVEAEAVDRDWINGFALNTTTNHRNLMVGYTGLSSAPGYYNRVCRAENFWQQMRSMGFIANGISFVYTEDNLAFHRDEYFKLGGYGQKTNEAYANLELIINQFIKKKSTVLLFNENSRLTKNVETGRDDYHNLLNRSFRIESYLPVWKRFMLGFESFTNLAFAPASILLLIFYFELWPILSGLVLLKILLQIVLLKISLKRLNERKIFIPSLVYGWLIPYLRTIYKWNFNRSRRRNKWRKRV